MATKQSTVNHLMDQLSGVSDVSARKMFGEYALYVNRKVVALVCDDQLFVKPTTAGKRFLGAVSEAPAYTGAKLSYVIPGEQWDDAEWLRELITITAAALPQPKPKKKKGVAGQERLKCK